MPNQNLQIVYLTQQIRKNNGDDPDYAHLARTHMAEQVKQAAAVQAGVGKLFDDIVDPSNLDASFRDFQYRATMLITAGRSLSVGLSQEYFNDVHHLAGYVNEVEVAAEVDELTATVRSLYINGYGALKKRLKEGVAVEIAMSQAQQSLLGAVKGRTLSAGRNRLVALSKADPNTKGWARVSDGNPCHFCAMLVSRGPVYTASTGAFQAHNKCGCSVRPVPRNDPSGGWSPEARAYSELWQDKSALDAAYEGAKQAATTRRDGTTMTKAQRNQAININAFRRAYSVAQASGRFTEVERKNVAAIAGV